MGTCMEMRTRKTLRTYELEVLCVSFSSWMGLTRMGSGIAICSCERGHEDEKRGGMMEHVQ